MKKRKLVVKSFVITETLDAYLTDAAKDHRVSRSALLRDILYNWVCENESPRVDKNLTQISFIA